MSIKTSLGVGWGEAGKPDSQDTPFEICNFLYPVLKLLSQCKLYILIRPITQWLQYFGLHVNMRVTSLSAVAFSRQSERNMFGHEKGRKNKTKASNLKFIQTDLHKMDIWQFHIFWALQTVIWFYPYWQSKGFCSKAESTKWPWITYDLLTQKSRYIQIAAKLNCIGISSEHFFNSLNLWSAPSLHKYAKTS